MINFTRLSPYLSVFCSHGEPGNEATIFLLPSNVHTHTHTHTQEHCKELANPRVEREFKLIEKRETQEDKMKVFSKNAFKRGAIQFYAR